MIDKNFLFIILVLISFTYEKNKGFLRNTQSQNSLSEDLLNIEIPKPARLNSTITITSDYYNISNITEITIIYYNEDDDIEKKNLTFCKKKANNCSNTFEYDSSKIIIMIEYYGGIYQLINITDKEDYVDLSKSSYYLRSFKPDKNKLFFQKGKSEKTAKINFDFFEDNILENLKIDVAVSSNSTYKCDIQNLRIYTCDFTFGIDSFNAYFVSITYYDEIPKSTTITFSLYVFIYSIIGNSTCSDNGKNISLLIESEENLGYNFDIYLDKEKQHKFSTQVYEKKNQIAHFKFDDEFKTSTLYIYLSDEELTIIEDYFLEFYPHYFINVDRTIVPMDKTQSIILTYSRKLQKYEFEKIIFFKDENNTEEIRYPKTYERIVICTIDFDYAKYLTEGEYTIKYIHKCGSVSNSGFSVFFGNLNVYSVSPPYYNITQTDSVTYNITLLGAIEGTKLVLKNEQNEQLDDVPYELIPFEEEFYFSFTIPPRNNSNTSPGKYFICIKDGIIQESEKYILVYNYEVEFVQNSKFLIFNKTLENPLEIQLNNEILSEQILKISFGYLKLPFTYENKIIKINTNELINEMKSEGKYDLKFELINEKILTYSIKYYMFKLINPQFYFDITKTSQKNLPIQINIENPNRYKDCFYYRELNQNPKKLTCNLTSEETYNIQCELNIEIPSKKSLTIEVSEDKEFFSSQRIMEISTFSVNEGQCHTETTKKLEVHASYFNDLDIYIISSEREYKLDKDIEDNEIFRGENFTSGEYKLYIKFNGTNTLIEISDSEITILKKYTSLNYLTTIEKKVTSLYDVEFEETLDYDISKLIFKYKSNELINTIESSQCVKTNNFSIQCRFIFGGQKSGEYNLYYVDSCGKEIKITDDNIPILIAELVTNYQILEINPKSLSLPMYQKEELFLLFDKNFTETVYVEKIRFVYKENYTELSYSFNVTLNEENLANISLTDFKIEESIKGEFKIKFVFNNGDYGLSDLTITFLALNFEFSRFNIILNSKSQILRVKILGDEKEKVTNIYMKPVNKFDAQYEQGKYEGNFTYSFIINNVEDKQFSYSKIETGDQYLVISRVIRVFESVDDFIQFDNINDCFYKFENSNNIIFKSYRKSPHPIDMQSIKAYVINTGLFKVQFYFNKIDNSYTLHSDEIKKIDYGNYYIKIVENDDFENPLLSQKITFSNLIYYSKYTFDNIIFNDVICNINNMNLIEKEREEKNLLNCNLTDNKILKCEYPFEIPFLLNHQDYYLNYENYKLTDTIIIPSFSISDFKVEIEGSLKIGENKIKLIPTKFNMSYLEKIKIENSNKQTFIYTKEKPEIIADYIFTIENNIVVFNLNIEAEISYKIIELTRTFFESDLSHEPTIQQVNIIINDNPEEPIQIDKIISNNLYEYEKDQSIIIFFNKNILPEEITNIIINNSTNNNFPFKNCIKNTESSLKCIFDLTNISKGEYILKSFDYKNEKIISNIQIKVLGKEPIESCKKGYISLDNKCILPENSNDFSSKKCSTNYCVNGVCVENGLIPNCNCNKEYTGLYCDIKENEISDYMLKLKSDFKSYDIYKLNDDPLIVKEINYYINNYSKKMSNSEYLDFLNIIIDTTKTIKEQSIEYNDNLYLLINLGMNAALKKQTIKVNIKQRNIQEEEDVLKDLINLSKDFINYYLSQNSFEENSIKLFTTDLSSINYIFTTNQEDSIKKLNQLSDKMDISSIDTSNCSSNLFTSSKNGKTLFTQIIFSKEIANSKELSKSEFISELINIGAYSYDSNLKKANLQDNIINQCSNLILKMNSSPKIKYDIINKYSQCSQNGINIYDSKDPAFNNQCFRCENGLNYDIPILYNRKNIIQQYKITKSQNSVSCYFSYINTQNKKVIMSCPKPSNLITENGFSYEIKQINQSFEKEDKEYNNGKIPFLCLLKISKIHKNYAFWFYLIMIILLSGIIVLFNFFKHNLLAIKNDKLGTEIKQETELQDQSNGPKEKEKDYDIDSNSSNSNSQVSNHEESKPFQDYFISNLIHLHPLISIFLPSLIGNQMINSLIFLFSIITTFGFNSLYFTQNMLEKRIESERRNNFFFCFKNFHRILLSIISMMLLNAIVRLICLVTKKKWNELDNLIRGSKDDKAKLNEADHFEKDMYIQRLITIIFIFVVTVFFFYYSVVFFSIYQNAQIEWFYSGIWGMIFNWVLFSSLYIAAISMIESDGLNEIAYYMKRIFIF